MESLFWMGAMQSDDAKAAMIHFLELPYEKRRDYIENGPFPASTGV